MEIAIAFPFEDWLQDPRQPEPNSLFQRYRIQAKAFGATKMISVDLTTHDIGQYYNHTDSQIDFEWHTSLANLEAAYTDDGVIDRIVYLESEAYLSANGIVGTDLRQFTHPTVSGTLLYLVGPDSGNVPTAGREGKEWVYIKNKAGEAMLSEAAAILALRAGAMQRGLT